MIPIFSRLRDETLKLYDQFWASEMVVFVTAAALVGLGAGLGALIFRWLIQSVENIAFGGGKPSGKFA